MDKPQSSLYRERSLECGRKVEPGKKGHTNIEWQGGRCVPKTMLRRYMITADRHVREAGRKLEAYHDRIKPTEAEETVQ